MMESYNETERKYLVTDDWRLSYLTNSIENTGESPLVTLLHPSTSDATILEQQLGHFRNDGIYTIAPDLRDHGESVPVGSLDTLVNDVENAIIIDNYDELPERVMDVFSLENYANDVYEILQKEGKQYQRVVLVGDSLGAYVAAVLVQMHPDEDIEVINYGMDWDKSYFKPEMKTAWLLEGVDMYKEVTSPNLDVDKWVSEHLQPRWHNYWADDLYDHEKETHYTQMKSALARDPYLFGLSRIGLHTAIAFYDGNAVFEDSLVFNDISMPHVALNGDVGQTYYKIIREKILGDEN